MRRFWTLPVWSVVPWFVVSCGAAQPVDSPHEVSKAAPEQAAPGGSSASVDEPLEEPLTAAVETGTASPRKTAAAPEPAPSSKARAAEPLEAPVVARGPKPKSGKRWPHRSPGGIGGIGDSYGAGGLGLSGVGEGGGGFGAGMGMGMGRASLKRGASPRRDRSAAKGQRGGVKAGEWDDNANFREFTKYLAQERKSERFDELDLTYRRFVVVKDKAGKGVPNCKVSIFDLAGRKRELTTTASGRALLFPRAEKLTGSSLRASAKCGGKTASKRFSLKQRDGVVELKLDSLRSLPAKRTLDVVFVLDTTGSMSEEISALKGTIQKVASTLKGMKVQPRLGLVEYKDRGDAYVTRMTQMTTDVAGFTERVAAIRASGGGDMPEHVNAGLRVAVDQLRWRDSSVARLVFLVGDAPPKLQYQGDVSYARSVRTAGQKGIKVFTIAASGMNDQGQVVWRQIAQYTGGTNLFVLRGGAGPQSTGAGDPKSSCGGTHENFSSGNLAELVSSRIERDIASLDGDPLRIAGLNKDEKAKPCEQRIAQR